MIIKAKNQGAKVLITTQQVSISGLVVEVVRKEIKNLHLGV